MTKKCYRIVAFLVSFVGTVVLIYLYPPKAVLSTVTNAFQVPIVCSNNSTIEDGDERQVVLAGYSNTSTPKCTHPACRLNLGRQPVKWTPVQPDRACSTVTSCVTLITRTRHRLLYVLKLVKSVRKLYPDIKIIVVDDIYLTEKKPDKIWIDWLNRQGLNDIIYIQTRIGLSYGRNIALRLVTTPYFFLTDDDFVFTEQTDLFRLVELLQNTDISIAAAFISWYAFEGLMRVTQDGVNNKPKVAFHTGVAYEKVPCFQQCYVMDNVKNCFMAKTEDIKKTGGWDNWKIFCEHEDFLMRMRLAQLKIALCYDVSLKHEQAERRLHDVRKQFVMSHYKLLLKQWDLEELYYCDQRSYSARFGCKAHRHYFS